MRGSFWRWGWRVRFAEWSLGLVEKPGEDILPASDASAAVGGEPSLLDAVLAPIMKHVFEPVVSFLVHGRGGPEVRAEQRGHLTAALWRDPDVGWLTGLHESDGVSYFAKEPYEALMWWLQLPAFARGGGGSSGEGGRRSSACSRRGREGGERRGLSVAVSAWRRKG